MKNITTEIKVGLFVIAGVVLLIGMFMILSPALDKVRYKDYYTNLKNAAGIIPKSQVRTNGVLVGQVSTVELDEHSTRVGLLLEQALKLPVGSTIEVRSRGLLGDVYLEIIRAPDSGEYIAEGGLIPNANTGMDMDSMMKTFGAIGQDIKKITGDLSSTTNEDGTSSLKTILQNLESSSKHLNEILGDNKTRIKSLVDNLDKTVAAIKEGMYDGDTNRFARIATNIDNSAESIAAITKKVERGEGTIGKLLNDETTIDKIEGALGDVRKFLSPISNLTVGVDWHAEAGTGGGSNDDAFRNYLNLKLQTRPDKYYMLGVADVGANDSLVQTSNTTTSTDGPTTTQNLNQESKEEKALKFNLQFAKRWGFAGLRVGLFETTGGMAGDFFAFNDRLRWTVEAFDFDEDDRAIRRTGHFKTYASYTFFSHIYALAGIDDFTRLGPDGKVDKDKDYFFGAGLQFNDNDLKALMGTVAGAAK